MKPSGLISENLLEKFFGNRKDKFPQKNQIWFLLSGWFFKEFFLEKNCLLNNCGLWTVRLNQLGKIIFGKIVNVFFRVCRRWAKDFWPAKRKFWPDCQTCSLRSRWNILGGEKSPRFYVPWFSDIRQKAFSHLAEWFRQSCRKCILRFKSKCFGKVMFFQINLWFLLSLLNIQRKNGSVNSFLFFGKAFKAAFYVSRGKLEKFLL